MIIQIYEIQTPEQAESMIELGVDHVGAVVLPEMGRKDPGLFETMRLVSDSPSKSSLIPLFSDIDRISRVIDVYRPDIIHFCNLPAEMSEDRERNFGKMISDQATIRKRFPEVKIMRSIPVPPENEKETFPVIEFARHFEELSDFFLIDTVLPQTVQTEYDGQPEKGFIGITGKTCDTVRARDLVRSVTIPVILAGGLSGENVYERVRAIRPAGVDSCTLTNATDANGNPVRFQKDIEKVKRFVKEARRAEMS